MPRSKARDAKANDVCNVILSKDTSPDDRAQRQKAIRAVAGVTSVDDRLCHTQNSLRVAFSRDSAAIRTLKAMEGQGIVEAVVGSFEVPLAPEFSGAAYGGLRRDVKRVPGVVGISHICTTETKGIEVIHDFSNDAVVAQVKKVHGVAPRLGAA